MSWTWSNFGQYTKNTYSLFFLSSYHASQETRKNDNSMIILLFSSSNITNPIAHLYPYCFPFVVLVSNRIATWTLLKLTPTPSPRSPKGEYEEWYFSGVIGVDDCLPSSRKVHQKKEVVGLSPKDKARYRLQKSKKVVGSPASTSKFEFVRINCRRKLCRRTWWG